MATQIQERTFINFSDWIPRESLLMADCQLCGKSHPFHEMHAVPYASVNKRRCHTCFTMFGGTAVKGQFKQMEFQA